MDTQNTPQAVPQDPMAKLNRLERILDSQAIDGEIIAATAGVNFASPAAKQHATALLRQGLRVGESGVKSADGRPAADYVRESLASSDFSHFVATSHRGGGTALSGGSTTAAPHAPAVEMPEPRTMGERMIAHALANRSSTTGNPQLDMTMGFGLGRKR